MKRNAFAATTARVKGGATACLALIVIAGLVPLTLAGQEPSDRALLDSLFQVRDLYLTSISPDGKEVAWSVRGQGAWITPLGGGTAQEVGTGPVTGFAWSPDSKHLAYVGQTTAGQKELFVIEPGAKPQPLTDVSGFLNEPAWSPDGKSIAFLFIENAKRDAGPLVAMSRGTGLIEEHIDEQRIAVVDILSRKVRMVTPANMYIYHFDWSPDSRQLAAEGAPGSGDNNYWTAQLYRVDATAATIQSVYKPKWQLANPKWSHDGKQIGFIEGLMSDEGSTGGDVMIINADGTSPQNLTPGMKASASAILHVSRMAVDFVAIDHGEETLKRVWTDHEGTAGTGEIETLWRGPEALTAISVTGDLKSFSMVRSTLTHPPEVFAGPLGAWKQITRINESIRPEAAETRSLAWKSDDFDVQGWLLFPQHYDPAKKYPLVVWTHGGPASAAMNKWSGAEAVLLSRHGFFILFPNPRGSYGQGERFTQGNVKDFGYGDLRDILHGVDTVLHDYPVDPKRVGIWGWSYGGYMTMWAITQTDRFHAAVSGAGVANWQSYYGENDIDQWMIPYFGASVYDDPAIYARSSPITFVSKVKTPTLFMAGERDGEVPAPQSYELWHALKTLGVETQLVIYADEGHHFAQPEHRRDVALRMVSWFVDHLPAGP